MTFLVTRLGDITVEEILAIFFPLTIVLCLISGFVLWAVKRRDDEENIAQPTKGSVVTVIDVKQNGDIFSQAEEWVIFEAETGERVRLLCKAEENFVVGDKGYLQWRGNRILSFKRGGVGETYVDTSNVHLDKANGDIYVTDNGKRWRCRCGKENLDGLIRCYYCGQRRPERRTDVRDR